MHLPQYQCLKRDQKHTCIRKSPQKYEVVGPLEDWIAKQENQSIASTSLLGPNDNHMRRETREEQIQQVLEAVEEHFAKRAGKEGTTANTDDNGVQMNVISDSGSGLTGLRGVGCWTGAAGTLEQQDRDEH